MLTWRRRSTYSIGDPSGLYAVSRSSHLDLETGARVDRYTAWYGPDLQEAPRGYFPECLGICASAAEAKALCEAHRADHG